MAVVREKKDRDRQQRQKNHDAGADHVDHRHGAWYRTCAATTRATVTRKAPPARPTTTRWASATRLRMASPDPAVFPKFVVFGGALTDPLRNGPDQGPEESRAGITGVLTCKTRR